jgi:hypothetical protein
MFTFFCEDKPAITDPSIVYMPRLNGTWEARHGGSPAEQGEAARDALLRLPPHRRAVNCYYALKPSLDAIDTDIRNLLTYWPLHAQDLAYAEAFHFLPPLSFVHLNVEAMPFNYWANRAEQIHSFCSSPSLRSAAIRAHALHYGNGFGDFSFAETLEGIAALPLKDFSHFHPTGLTLIRQWSAAMAYRRASLVNQFIDLIPSASRVTVVRSFVSANPNAVDSNGHPIEIANDSRTISNDQCYFRPGSATNKPGLDPTWAELIRYINHLSRTQPGRFVPTIMAPRVSGTPHAEDALFLFFSYLRATDNLRVIFFNPTEKGETTADDHYKVVSLANRAYNQVTPPTSLYSKAAAAIDIAYDSAVINHAGLIANKDDLTASFRPPRTAN